MVTVTKLVNKHYKIALYLSCINYVYIGYIMLSSQVTGDSVLTTKNELIK